MKKFRLLFAATSRVTPLDCLLFSQSFSRLLSFEGQTFCSSLDQDKGSPPVRKVQFFLTLFKRPLPPPPFYLNICPILQGVFFMIYMI